MFTEQSVAKVLETVARQYRGPGGALAVLKDGNLVGQRLWGHADIDQRIPMTPEIQMPICSITKQFVCALLIDLERNPPREVAAKGDIRIWYTGLLGDDHALGSPNPEGQFLIERDGPAAIERTRSFHFNPGTEFSYCNVNFYIVARVIEQVTGQPLGKLLAERVLVPAGMSTALLCPDTAQHPGPCVGYEGNEQCGYRAAVNRMEWAGDAGLVASLTDMVAYENNLDRIHSDAESWYRIATEPHTFSDGHFARYRYGLGHTDIEGLDTIGHGGALRGYRLHRRHIPSERISVVALFNHEADASAAVNDVIRRLLGLNKPVGADITANSNWIGSFLDQDSGLAITVSKGPKTGEISISYEFSPETEVIRLTSSDEARSNSMAANIQGDILNVYRIEDNRKLEARRIVSREGALEDISFLGDYHCAEVDSVFHCVGEAGMLYGSFDGYLGRGPASSMKYLGEDVWALLCQRGLDAPAPGDWTLCFHRNEDGAVVSIKVGCWLARGLVFVKV